MGKKGWFLDTGLPFEMVDWVRFAPLTKNMIENIIIFILGSIWNVLKVCIIIIDWHLFRSRGKSWIYEFKPEWSRICIFRTKIGLCSKLFIWRFWFFGLQGLIAKKYHAISQSLVWWVKCPLECQRRIKKDKKWPNLKLKHIINYFMGESSLKWQNSKCCWKFVPIAFNHIYNNSKSTHVLVLVGDYCNYVSWKMFY